MIGEGGVDLIEPANFQRPPEVQSQNAASAVETENTSGSKAASKQDDQQAARKLLAQIMEEGTPKISPEPMIQPEERIPVEKKKPQGFFARIWEWFKDLFNLTK